MGDDTVRCSTAGDETVDAGTANEGTGAPDAATLVGGHRDEAIPNLHVAGGSTHPSLSWAILETEEALPYARTELETEVHENVGAHSEILDQSWILEEGVGENGCGGSGDGYGDDDGKEMGVAGDVHCPSCMSASNASFPAMSALEGNGTGTANGHKRRVSAKDGDTDRLGAT